MKTEEQLLSDSTLLAEIVQKRAFIDDIRQAHWYNDIPFSIADDYMMSDIEAHIYKLEREAFRRGLKIPERYPE